MTTASDHQSVADSRAGNPKLTAREQRFCQEYLIDLVGTKAAIRAKYSPKSAGKQACKLLAKPHIQDALAVAMAERAERIELTDEAVLNELMRLGFSNIMDFVTWAENGDVTVRGAEDLTRDQAAAISEITTIRTVGGAVQTKLKLYDKRGALETLGRYLGLIVDRSEQKHVGPNGGPVEMVVKVVQFGDGKAWAKGQHVGHGEVDLSAIATGEHEDGGTIN